MAVLVVVVLSGCGTVNGVGRDLENGGRWLREVTQKNVDKTELQRIRSGIDEQNRIVERGNALLSARQ
jgi:predicted small secreted protein